MIESAYEQSGDGRTPDFYHAEQMLGTAERASGAVIASTLEKETAERLRSRAEISKELRKSKESLSGGGGKGDGKTRNRKTGDSGKGES